jgi:protein-tyrosine phosphatase
VTETERATERTTERTTERESMERLIALEGAVNFRDLGGYPVEDGGRTRWRVLFRADGLGDLTDADFTVMRALGIRTVIDLRSGDELERGRFDVEAHPVTFHHFPIIEQLPDADEFDRRPGLLGSQYQEMLRDAGDAFVEVLRILAAPDALPAVFHCTAGKDRTGVLSALVLSLLGVDEEIVVADYALSGEAMTRLKAKIIVKYPDSRETIENISEVFSAAPAQMEALLDHLRAEYGSVDAYLRRLGADDELIRSLREALLEPMEAAGT